MARILVVDDDTAILTAICRVLENSGFEVLKASDGREAMRLLQENDIDLTIADVFMPNVDGMEFTIRVRQQLPDAKIITISGGGLLDKGNVLDIAKSVGAAATIAKPFQMEVLLDVVKEVLELPHHTAAPSSSRTTGRA